MTSLELAHLRLQGSAVHCIPANQPFRYLGAQLTLSMDSKPHLQSLVDMIHTKGLDIARSPASLRQKMEMEHQCIATALAYHLHIAPFSSTQLQALDKARARVLKSMLKISNSSPTDMLYARQVDYGAGATSLTPMYAQISAESLTMMLNDTGRLGVLSRAVMAAQLKQAKASLDAPVASWSRFNTHMMLRQAYMAHAMGLCVRYDSSAVMQQASMDLYELVTTMAAAKSVAYPLEFLQKHVIQPLWAAFGSSTAAYLSQQRCLSMTEIHTNFPQQLNDGPVRTAYLFFLHLCCSSAAQLRHLAGGMQLPPPPAAPTLILPMNLSRPSRILQNGQLSLPRLVELKAVLQRTPHSVGGHAQYEVSWCDSVATAGRCKRLAKFGIFPVSLVALLPDPLVTWCVSTLTKKVIELLWPAKWGKLRVTTAAQLPDSRAAGI